MRWSERSGPWGARPWRPWDESPERPSLNQVGPAATYAVLNDFQTWVLTFAMLLGRLELFTLFIVLTPAFWRK